MRRPWQMDRRRLALAFEVRSLEFGGAADTCSDGRAHPACDRGSRLLRVSGLMTRLTALNRANSKRRTPNAELPTPNSERLFCSHRSALREDRSELFSDVADF